MSLDMSKERTTGMAAAFARMLTTLEQKVDPSHAVLLVVDMQNDFCAPGGFLDRQYGGMAQIQAMAPRLVKFIEKAREIKLPIIFIQAEYNTENTWYLSDVWLEHFLRSAKKLGKEGGYIDYPVCEPNSWGWDFYDGIKPLPGELVVKKHRFSAFINTELDLILRSKGIRTLIMSGVGTNICVETTARDGFMKDYYIAFLRDCTATSPEELHYSTLENIEYCFGEVVDSSDVVRCWEKTE